MKDQNGRRGGYSSFLWCITYEKSVLQKILDSKEELSVDDDGWYEYWSARCENPLDDAGTLMYDAEDYLVEIGQKTTELSKVQSQYIGLMRFSGQGLKAVFDLSIEAQNKAW